jgi:hypothetical protein
MQRSNKEITGEIMETVFSNILCIANMNITGALDQCLADLALPEVFVQRAKQISLVDKHGLLGRPVTRLEESRALIYHMYVPLEYGEGVMRRIAEVTDLKMGGRGCIFSRQISLRRGSPLSFDTEKLERLCEKTKKHPQEQHVLINCTVQRGGGDALVEAILKLGICVPIVSFGTGMGFRDKLGLLRITIPIEKEIIWFIVPLSDVDLVEKTLIPRARLDTPGKGFMYSYLVYAPVVNLRIRHGKRSHAATMEQVIAAMDEVRGSSDWRRLGPHKTKYGSGETKNIHTRGVFFIGNEEEVDSFRITAMENGAHGATLNSLEMCSFNDETQEQSMDSRSRSLCDIIISPEVEEKIRKPLTKTGLFKSGSTCLLKALNVEIPSAVRPFGSTAK